MKQRKQWQWDVLACVLLVVLWGTFFWRFLTPAEADQVSLAEGDFSGQFVAFGAYQADRMWDGEVPLWNPYNNGGHPFLADTQSAVFYPPRLISIWLTSFDHLWTYHTLELEMMAHLLMGSLFMFLFMRRLSPGGWQSVVGAFVGALIWAYGGFMTGYPPLQLALLEAVIWMPLIMLGIHEATKSEERFAWPWLVFSGVSLGLCAMAGHPQTLFHLGWFYVAFLGYRVYSNRWHWMIFIGGAGGVAVFAMMLAAVQLLPAAEYTMHTTRINFGFDAKSNGFPIYDVLQILFPRLLSVWSPLYISIVGIVLAVVAVWRRVKDGLFWAGAAIVVMLFSFGGNAALYGLIYNLLPGLKLFRGQERGAMLIAFSLSVLAGLGMIKLLRGDLSAAIAQKHMRRGLAVLVIVIAFVTLVAFVLWLGPANEYYGDELPILAQTLLIAGATLLALPWLAKNPADRWRVLAIIAIIIFDLFSVGWHNLLTESIPPADRLPQPDVVEVVLADDSIPPQRVDGIRGLMDNYGTMWQVPDIRGISPLWMQGPHKIIQEPNFPNPLGWELFAVDVVITDWQQLPVASTVIMESEDPLGPINVHQLAEPRPFALLMDDVALVDSDEFAYALLADPAFNPRESIILDERELAQLPEDMAVTGAAVVSDFHPEHIVIALEDVETPSVLSVALSHYPGWHALVDGEEVPVLRAYGSVSAVLLPAESTMVELIYDPLSFKLGRGISVIAWGGVMLFAVWQIWRSRSRTTMEERRAES